MKTYIALLAAASLLFCTTAQATKPTHEHTPTKTKTRTVIVERHDHDRELVAAAIGFGIGWWIKRRHDKRHAPPKIVTGVWCAPAVCEPPTVPPLHNIAECTTETCAPIKTNIDNSCDAKLERVLQTCEAK